MGKKNIIRNICRIQAYNLRMHGYFCIGFIDFMLEKIILLDYTFTFSQWLWEEWQNSAKIFLKLKTWKNYISLFAVSIKNLKNLKYHTS